MKLRNTLLSSAAAILALTAVTPAFAQQLEEVVVTARRVEENLMTVPLAVTAIGASQIEAMNIKDIGDIARITPSFDFAQMSGGSGRNDRSGGGSLRFRGLSIGGGVMFIDGSPVTGQQPPSPSDIERIEVLKGPQSVYFGRSTFMGAINFVTRDPSPTYQGRVTAEYSSFDSHQETLSLEGPISGEWLSGRVSLRNYTQGGYYENAFNPTEMLGARNSKSISASLYARPTQSLRAKLFLNYFKDHDNSPAQAVVLKPEFNCSFPGTARSRTGYVCGVMPTVSDLPARRISADSFFTPELQQAIYTAPDLWKVYDPTNHRHFGFKREAFQAHFRVDYDFLGGHNFSTIAAYHKDKNSNVIDSTYTAEGDRINPTYNPAVPFSPRNFTFMRFLQSDDYDYSLEGRVTSPQDQRIRYTFGASYLRSFSPGSTVYGVDVRGLVFAASRTKSTPITPAVFGGLYVDILEDLTLTAEGRYQWDTIKQTPFVGLNGQLVTGPAAAQLANTFKSFSPRVSLDWNFAPDSTVYALFSRGHQPGGFNAALATAAPDVLAVLREAQPDAGLFIEEERLDNYELGVRHTFMNRRARVALTGYYMEWINGRQSASIPVRTGSVTNLVGLTINTALAKLKGFEFEGQFQATDNLRLSATAGMNASKIATDNFALYNCADCANNMGDAKAGLGNRFPGTPKWTWSLTADYSDKFVGDYEWFTRVDYSHRGRSYVDFSGLAWFGASENVNARVGIRNEVFTLEAFVTNLTNDDTLNAGIASFDVYTFSFPPQENAIRVGLPMPRMWGARMSYRF